MRLSFFDIDGREHYEACVYEGVILAFCANFTQRNPKR